MNQTKMIPASFKSARVIPAFLAMAGLCATISFSFASQPPATTGNVQPPQGQPTDGRRTVPIDPTKVMRIDPNSIKPGSIVKVPIRKEPQFSSEESKAIAGMLSGSWKSSAPIAVPGADAAEMVISAGPIFVMGEKDTIYVEMARADGLHRPYRHLVWRLVNIKGVWNLQSLEFRRSKGQLPNAIGFFGTAEGLPVVSGDDLVATMSIPLTNEGGTLRGSSTNRFPTRIGGAVEMSSEISISADKITVADRGYDASGAQVWGPAQGESYSFVKTDLGFKTSIAETGLVAVTYPTTLTGEPAKEGELISVNYIGYLPDGTIFDSSFERNAPFQYAKGSRLIEGWNVSMNDAQAGLRRRIYVPFPLAYGDRARGKIPAMSDLVFELEVVKVEPAPATDPAPAAPAAPGAPAAGGQNSPRIESAEPPPELKAKMEADIRQRMEEKMKRQAEEAAKKAEDAVKPSGEPVPTPAPKAEPK